MVSGTSTRRNALGAFGTASKKGGHAEDVIRAAGGDFDLRKVSLSKWSGKPCTAGNHIIIRTDTDTAVGMVGVSYEPFANMDFFPPIANALVDDTGARIRSFSMLDEGSRASMLLDWDEDIKIGPAKVGDIVSRQAMITTSHNGKWAGKLVLIAMRLACDNGMTVPCGQSEFALTHSKGGHTQLRDIVTLTPEIANYFRNFAAAAEIMAKAQILDTSDQCHKIIAKIVDPSGLAGDTKSGEANAAKNRCERIHALFAGNQPGADNRAVKNTGWGLFSAAADWFNHGRDTRGENEPEQRFRSLIPGKNGGAAAKDIVRAWGIVGKELKIEKEIAAVCCN